MVTAQGSYNIMEIQYGITCLLHYMIPQLLDMLEIKPGEGCNMASIK